MIQKYWGKISGPLLDRIDLQIEVPRLKMEEISGRWSGPANTGGKNTDRPASGTASDVSSGKTAPENSQQIKQRVLAARAIQKNRYGRSTVLNGQLKGKEIKKFIRLESGAEKILEQAAAKFFLSYRAIEKILKVSRTIADLERAEQIATAHLTEALNYRLFKNYF